MEVAGVDGCPGGWLVVRAEPAELLRIKDIAFAPNFEAVLSQAKSCDAIAIDVPIGPMDTGTRLADREARKVLGRRASCVFPSVIRPVLGIDDYYEACNVSFAIQGKRIPKRAFTLGLRSHEVDQPMSPELQQRVVEIHPEICFWALNGGRPVLESKRTPAGAFERLQLLAGVFANELTAIAAPAGAALDDYYDACAAAWTAWRFATGQAQRLPPDPPTDSMGLRMEIVY
jgi:predicted RNase H-like nuclease